LEKEGNQAGVSQASAVLFIDALLGNTQLRPQAAERQKLRALHLPVTPDPPTSSSPAKSWRSSNSQCPDLAGTSPA